MKAEHNHLTRDIKPKGQCEGCDKLASSIGVILNDPVIQVQR